MKVNIIEEHGYNTALTGLALSYNQNPEKMKSVAQKLCFKGGGHNKFLESIILWIDITAPRYFYQQLDTYRIGVTKQSESTMHTMTKRPLWQDDFACPIPAAHLDHLNQLIEAHDWEAVKHDLPESFLQRRIVCMSYMTLQRIIMQRTSHRLVEWSEFISEIIAKVKHPEFLRREKGLTLTGPLCQKT